MDLLLSVIQPFGFTPIADEIQECLQNFDCVIEFTLVGLWI